MLLPLGMSFFAGRLTCHQGKVVGKEQAFFKDAAVTNMTMSLATAPFALPTVLFCADLTDEDDAEEKHRVTRGLAVVQLLHLVRRIRLPPLPFVHACGYVCV